MPDRRSIAFALEALAQHLAMATHRLRSLARAAFRWFLVGPAPLHLAEGALALHFFLEHPQRGIDVVVADEDLHRGDAFLVVAALTSAEEEKGEPRWAGSPLLSPGSARLGLLQVDRRGLALLAAFELEAQLLPLVQIAEAGALDRRDV